MNLKILSSLTKQLRSNLLIIGTHNGIFHSDDIVACALLCLLYSDKQIRILRTRDAEMLAQCNLCVDIGGGKFDHHQTGFNQTRENGKIYASAGLIWKYFGEQLITLMLEKYFPKATCDISSIFKAFDETYIIPVDCEDNGIPVKTHCFSFISSFLPLWFHNREKNYNAQFYSALKTTIVILEQKLKDTIAKEISISQSKFSIWGIKSKLVIASQTTKTTIAKKISKQIVEANWKNSKYFQNGILEIPSQTLFWTEPAILLNESIENNKINFVIFPYPDGGWAAQCVPPSLADKFGKRIPFPIEWAGQKDKLAEISDIDDAILCHNLRFFVRAKTKESVIQLCNIAIKQNQLKTAEL